MGSRYPERAQRLTGCLHETCMHYDAMLRTASELGMEVPALQSMGKYLDQSNNCKESCHENSRDRRWRHR